MRSTVSLMVLAATQAAQVESLLDSLNSRGNKRWNWNNYVYNDDETITQEIDLNFDIGARFDLPMGYDGEADYYFNQSVSAYAGGFNTYQYETDYFSLEMDLWFFPVWWDILYNQVKLNWVEMSGCDSAHSMLTLWKIYFDFTVGVYTCDSTVYDYFWNDYLTHSCEMTYYGFADVFNYEYSHMMYEMYPSTCASNPHWHYIIEPSGPTTFDAPDIESADTTPADATSDMNAM